MVIQWPVPGIVWADYASLVYLATHLLLELSLSPCVDSVIVSCFRSGCGTDFKQDIVISHRKLRHAISHFTSNGKLCSEVGIV